MSKRRITGQAAADYVQDLIRRRKSESAVRLADAKRRASSRGKEPFSLESFDLVYRSSSPPSGSLEERQRRWELRYYVDFECAMTIEEFARAVERNDLYDGGDMYLD